MHGYEPFFHKRERHEEIVVGRVGTFVVQRARRERR